MHTRLNSQLSFGCWSQVNLSLFYFYSSKSPSHSLKGIHNLFSLLTLSFVKIKKKTFSNQRIDSAPHLSKTGAERGAAFNNFGIFPKLTICQPQSTSCRYRPGVLRWQSTQDLNSPLTLSSFHSTHLRHSPCATPLMPLKSHCTKSVQRLPDLCDSSPQDYKDKHKDSQLSKKDQVVRMTQPEEVLKKQAFWLTSECYL